MLRHRWLAIGLVPLGWCAAARTAPPSAIESRAIGDVRMLSADVLATRPEMRIRGVVTFRGNIELIVQDETGGILTNFRAAAEAGIWNGGDAPPADVAIGDEVEVEGVATDSDVSPGFLPRRLVRQGPGRLPEIEPTDAELFFSGRNRGMLVTFRGVVHRIRDADTHWRISLGADARPFSSYIAKPLLAEVLGRAPEGLTEATLADVLVDSVVQVSGPVMLRTNNRNAWFEPQVNVGRADWFTILEPPPQPAFSAPLVSLGMLARQQLNRESPLGHRIRTSGIVIRAVPGEAMFLQDESRGIRVDTTSVESFLPGDQVEAAGFPVRRGRLAGLTDAVLRKVGSGPPPRPVDLAAPVDAAFVGSEGRLVRLEATLLAARSMPEGLVLTLAADTTQVDAILGSANAGSLPRFEPGAVLSVTGVGETAWRFDADRWPLQVPDRLRLLVRSPADVRVVRQASWWTPRRLAALLGGAGAALAAALAWTVTLRRRLRIQTQRLAVEMRSRRDAAVEFAATLQERNRLAANLHDTLLQTLAGIGYQLDACECSRRHDEHDARLHFDIARRMVGHAASELHAAVWTMRSLPIRERSFPEAVRAVAARVGEGHPAAIEVRTAGPFEDVPEFVAGNLLLIVQEALHNALRHGRPRTIGVEIERDPETRAIRAVVRDDGAGFDAAAGAADRGLEAGHFGLVGMRERAERLGGTFHIESRRGAGTIVTVDVRSSEFDRELAEPTAVQTR